MPHSLAYQSVAPLRRYGLPLGAGLAIFVVGRSFEILESYLHLPSMATMADQVLLGLLVAGLIYFLQQRFDATSARLQDFASDVAHQLRTPLAIIRSASELGLQHSMSVSQYQDTLDSILEETERVSRLVEALLLLTRMDSGQVWLVPTKLHVSRFVRDVASDLEVLAQEKSQVYAIHTHEDALVEVDVGMFRQVLMNLLSNAIKYTPLGGTITVETHRLPSQHVEIVVSDNGPGIRKEEREKVFERFYRAAPDRDGTGLGLAISKWIVEEHKGKIFCDSEAGEGCRFIVRIPTCDAANVTSS